MMERENELFNVYFIDKGEHTALYKINKIMCKYA